MEAADQFQGEQQQTQLPQQPAQENVAAEPSQGQPPPPPPAPVSETMLSAHQFLVNSELDQHNKNEEMRWMQMMDPNFGNGQAAGTTSPPSLIAPTSDTFGSSQLATLVQQMSLAHSLSTTDLINVQNQQNLINQQHQQHQQLHVQPNDPVSELRTRNDLAFDISRAEEQIRKITQATAEPQAPQHHPITPISSVIAGAPIHQQPLSPQQQANQQFASPNFSANSAANMQTMAQIQAQLLAAQVPPPPHGLLAGAPPMSALQQQVINLRNQKLHEQQRMQQMHRPQPQQHKYAIHPDNQATTTGYGYSTIMPRNPPQIRRTKDGVTKLHPLFKSRLCRHFCAGSFCAFGDLCRFAHGTHEVRMPKESLIDYANRVGKDIGDLQRALSLDLPVLQRSRQGNVRAVARFGTGAEYVVSGAVPANLRTEYVVAAGAVPAHLRTPPPPPQQQQRFNQNQFHNQHAGMMRQANAGQAGQFQHQAGPMQHIAGGFTFR